MTDVYDTQSDVTPTAVAVPAGEPESRTPTADALKAAGKIEEDLHPDD